MLSLNFKIITISSLCIVPRSLVQFCICSLLLYPFSLTPFLPPPPFLCCHPFTPTISPFPLLPIPLFPRSSRFFSTSPFFPPPLSHPPFHPLFSCQFLPHPLSLRPRYLSRPPHFNMSIYFIIFFPPHCTFIFRLSLLYLPFALVYSSMCDLFLLSRACDWFVVLSPHPRFVCFILIYFICLHYFIFACIVIHFNLFILYCVLLTCTG